MTLKLKLFFLATLLVFISCSSSNDEIEMEKEVVIGNVSKLSYYFPGMSPTTEYMDPNYYFEYDAQNRVVRKNGGKIKLPKETEYTEAFSNKAYTIVTYNGNLITTSAYISNSNGEIFSGKKVFELDNQQRIAKCLVFIVESIVEKELIYQYQANKLVAIVTQYPNGDLNYKNVDRFTYYSDGNLKGIKTVTMQNNVDLVTRQEIEFSNYDKAPNPFKKLNIFDEHFHLSLSKNNPQKKITLEYVGGELASKQEVWWTNQYNADGTLKLFY
ncbi:hypothetical protein QWZ06_00730 [Chryseobacterium tructae]|uniref:DUF4595 domain-containing protein n=1 Tax=Chryseobacterium tructae TaxID=1037380 RepID=A0ABV7XQV1_9FLAO|nr:hypothetical protein [Chryseobacterium tructae]MDN3690897.1 hypothetical protein [Chryseobacterium tructae]